MSFVLLAFPDVHGALRGKALSARAFEGVVEQGATTVTDLLLALDPVDEPITDYERFGLRSGAGDLVLAPDLDTLRSLSWRPGWSVCLATPAWPDGRPCELAPRTVLERVLGRLRHESMAAFEYELRLRAVAGEPATSGLSYSLLELGPLDRFVDALESALAGLGIELSAIHTEPAPGLVELNLGPRRGVLAADEAALAKLAVKDLAGAHGMRASFLAKPDAGLEGSSGHLHLSLWDGDAPRFAGEPGELPPALAAAVAGALRHLPAASLLYNPTLNSYKRLVPGFFAPVNVSWGYENRSAAVRAITPERASVRRLECRRPGADANPYLALAGLVASVTAGLREDLRPPPPLSGDVSGRADLPALPSSLEAALAAFADDGVLREELGEPFCAYFETSRRWELAAWQRAVTQWERDRYERTV
jgi:glutamine synthetase